MAETCSRLTASVVLKIHISSYAVDGFIFVMSERTYVWSAVEMGTGGGKPK